MQIYFSQNIRYFSHCTWKNSVLMEKHYTLSKRYFFNNIRNVLHELRSKGSRREFWNLKPCHATRGGFVSAATDLVMFQEKREAYVLKFFIVNIPPSETVSSIFLYNTHNFQLFSSHLSKQINCSTVQGFFKSLFGLWMAKVSYVLKWKPFSKLYKPTKRLSYLF